MIHRLYFSAKNVNFKPISEKEEENKKSEKE